MTLIKELDLLDIAGHTMMYMVEHPQRKWISTVGGVMITNDAAYTKTGTLLAIARGERPIVYGIEGTAVGWILESEGNIIAGQGWRSRAERNRTGSKIYDHSQPGTRGGAR